MKKRFDKLVNHYESDKPTHKYAKILLGLYGFGLKVLQQTLEKRLLLLPHPVQKSIINLLLFIKNLARWVRTRNRS